MENIAAIIQSIASLVWPLIVILVLFTFRSSIKDLIETAKSRKFTVKVGGSELTMEELSKQQHSLIDDLQNKLGELQKQVDAVTKILPNMPAQESTKSAEKQSEVARLILWVDDNPRNNSFLAQSIQDKGVEVVTALSTKEAIEKFKSAKFDRVITDMGRNEDGRFNSIAGLELTENIRKFNPNIPIFIFTNWRTAQEQKIASEQVGVTDITSSPSTLLNLLNINETQKNAAQHSAD